MNTQMLIPLPDAIAVGIRLLCLPEEERRRRINMDLQILAERAQQHVWRNLERPLALANQRARREKLAEAEKLAAEIEASEDE